MVKGKLRRREVQDSDPRGHHLDGSCYQNKQIKINLLISNLCELIETKKKKSITLCLHIPHNKLACMIQHFTFHINLSGGESYWVSLILLCYI